jgi:hypothetical protein
MKSNNFGLNISSVGTLRFLNDIHRKNIYCAEDSDLLAGPAETCQETDCLEVKAKKIFRSFKLQINKLEILRFAQN